MQIAFKVDGVDVYFARNCWTGKMTLTVEGHEMLLQDPWNPSTHVSLQTMRSWNASVFNRLVTIEKQHPLFMPGLRPQSYRILVDGQLVAEQKGY